MFRCEPVERTHGESVVLSVPDSKLLFKVGERIKAVGSIEVFVVFSMAAFDFPVMSGCVWLDRLVADAKLPQFFFE